MHASLSMLAMPAASAARRCTASSPGWRRRGTSSARSGPRAGSCGESAEFRCTDETRSRVPTVHRSPSLVRVPPVGKPCHSGLVPVTPARNQQAIDGCPAKTGIPHMGRPSRRLKRPSHSAGRQTRARRPRLRTSLQVLKNLQRESELSLSQDEIPNGWEEAAAAERRLAGLGPVNLRAEWRKLVAYSRGGADHDLALARLGAEGAGRPGGPQRSRTIPSSTGRHCSAWETSLPGDERAAAPGPRLGAHRVLAAQRHVGAGAGSARLHPAGGAGRVVPPGAGRAGGIADSRTKLEYNVGRFCATDITNPGT